MAKLKGTTFGAIERLLLNTPAGRRGDTDASVTIGNNTTAEFANGGASIVIRLHGNAIVQLDSDDSVNGLNLCGYPTVTTRERINQFLPEAWKVVSVKRVTWMVYVDSDGTRRMVAPIDADGGWYFMDYFRRTRQEMMER